MRGKLVFFVVLLGIIACGDSTSPRGGPRASIRTAPAGDSASIPNELIPADALVVVTLDSLDTMRAIAKTVGAAAGTGLGSTVDRFVMSTGVKPEDIDMSRPVVIAVTVPAAMPMPLPTYVLPVKNPEAVASSSAMTAAVAGGYVGLSMVQGYKAGEGSKLAHNLPGGDVVVRVDLARVMELFGAQINMQLDMAQQMAASAAHGSPAMGTVFDGLREMVASAEQLDIVAGMDGSAFHVDTRFTVRAESSLDKGAKKSGLAELAVHLPADLPVVSLFSLDLSRAMGLFDVWTGRIPEEQRAAFDKQLAATKELMKDLGEDWAFGADVGADGIRLVCVGRAGDAEAYAKKYVEFVTSAAFAESGVIAKAEGQRPVGGTTVHRVRLRIDAEKYAAIHGARAGDAAAVFGKAFGEQGAVVDVAAKGDRLVIAVDKRGALCEQALAGEDAPPVVASTRKHAPGELGFLLHVDLRELMRGVAELSGKSDVPDGEPVPIALYGSRDGRVYIGGFRLDVEKTGELARQWK